MTALHYQFVSSSNSANVYAVVTTYQSQHAKNHRIGRYFRIWHEETENVFDKIINFKILRLPKKYQRIDKIGLIPSGKLRSINGQASNLSSIGISFSLVYEQFFLGFASYQAVNKITTTRPSKIIEKPVIENYKKEMID